MTRHPLRRGTARPVVLEYTDAAGDASTREVMPLAILFGAGRRSAKTTYLQGRCSTRRAVRAFRFDRVLSISDPTSGEVQTPDEWLTTVPLEVGAPFTWDEAAEDAAAAPATHTSDAAAPGVAWRAILIAITIGYVIGRLRVLRWLLRTIGAHTGLWL